MIRMILALTALPLLAACSGGGAAASDPLTSAHVESQVLIMLTEFETEEEEDDELNKILGKLNGLSARQIGNTAFFVLDLPAGADLAAVLRDLDDDVNVVVSEPNYVAESPEGGPEDLPTLGSDLLSAIPMQPQLAALGLAQAHATSTGAGVVVAIVDTGFDMTHPALAGRIAPGGFDFIGQDADPTDERDFLDNDADGNVDEQFGHGTFIASLVLAVAPDALVMPVRVLDAEGFGDASAVAAGIIWAVDAGATVINVSVDIPDASEVVKEAISYAEDRDVVVVAAAGNGAAPDIIFPARFGDVVGVTAVDAAGVLAPFSNVGSAVSLVAPGVDLIGAVPESLNPAGTARWSGTSFAAPLVSGTAALVRALDPGLRRRDVIQRIENSAVSVNFENPGYVGRLGAGLVQPAAALAP